MEGNRKRSAGSCQSYKEEAMKESRHERLKVDKPTIQGSGFLSAGWIVESWSLSRADALDRALDGMLCVKLTARCTATKLSYQSDRLNLRKNFTAFLNVSRETKQIQIQGYIIK